MLTDASAILSDFAAGRTDPVAILQRCIAALDEHNAVLNAATVRAPDPMTEARAARHRWRQGKPIGPLDGLPIIIKDNLHTAGLPTSWGNRHLAGIVRDHDQFAVAALRDAGAVIIGKGNTPEFAVEGYTANAVYGVTRNPLDPDLTPGGSSGGVVSVVASGMALAGLATDGGGSIRRPAGFTGLWGLRTGLGAVSKMDGPPQVLLDFETIGPITRSARDLALFYDVLARQTRPAPNPVKRVLAVSHMNDAPCDPTIQAVFRKTAERLTGMGCDVRYGKLPIDLTALNSVWTMISEIGLAHLFRSHPALEASAQDKYRDLARAGEHLPATKLYDILRIVADLREGCAELWGFDAVLMPTSAANPWPAEEPYPTKIDGQTVGPRGHAVYTGWVNAAGLPALAVPTQVSQKQSIGMQLVSAAGREWDLLALAQALEGRPTARSDQCETHLT